MRQEAITLFPQIKMAYTLHNWADERRFFSASEESRRDRTIPVILYAGRLNPEKGVHILLEAMRILMERNVDVICKVVGSSRFGGSKPDAYVRSLIRSNPGNVHFTAYLSANDVAEEYRVADILCCPSVYQEAFGFVNIEAMACGIPVVATRVGGIPEIASEGGFILVEPNSPVELADALQKLICDSALRSKLAEEGLRSFRRQFTWDAVRSQYLEIIERLM
jgi:spore coat protein SA